MKKIKSLFIISALSLLTVSCSRDFLETSPSTSVGETAAETTEQGLNGILNGLHYMTYSYNWGNAHTFGSGQRSIGAQLDMMGDDGINTKPAYYMGVYRWQDHINPNGDINYKTWDFYYTLILHANKLISGSNNLGSLTKEKKAQLLGEGYAFRAWAYHNLVQLFAKRYEKGQSNDQLGVIIRTENNLLDPLPRSSVAEVYTQIDKDMSLALENLKVAKDSGAKNSIRYTTALGIAARIALSKSDWAKAAEYADNAIKLSGATLQTGAALVDGFNNVNATEWMWGYQQGPTQDDKFYSFYANFSYNFQGYNKSFRFAVNRSLYDKMGADDVRRKWWVCLDKGDAIPADAYTDYFSGGAKTSAAWEITGQSIKFKARGANDSRGDLLIMRLAEMYYIKAEAEARSGTGNAQLTLNTIMKTRDKNYNTTLSGSALIDEIMRNKRLDLWLEGQRFFDMKRLGVVPKRLEAANFSYLTGTNLSTAKTRNTGSNAANIPTTADSKYWQFAIPYDEIKGNPLCVQNEL